MVQRSRQFGAHNAKLQMWMFGVCQQESMSVETRLISNKFSTVQVVNFILNMEKP